MTVKAKLTLRKTVFVLATLRLRLIQHVGSMTLLVRCVQTESNQHYEIARNVSVVLLDHNWIVFWIIALIITCAMYTVHL